MIYRISELPLLKKGILFFSSKQTKNIRLTVTNQRSEFQTGTIISVNAIINSKLMSKNNVPQKPLSPFGWEALQNLKKETIFSTLE